MTRKRRLKIARVPFHKKYRQSLEVPYILLGYHKTDAYCARRIIEMMTFLKKHICLHFMDSNI